MRKFEYTKDVYNCLTPEIINLLSEIHEYKGKHLSFINSEPDILKSLLKVAKIQSTEASNRIEGIQTSDLRLKKIVENTTKPQNRDEMEIMGYRDVLETVNDSYEFIPINQNVLLQLHKDLYKHASFNMGGKFKLVDNIIGDIDEQGNTFVRFKPMSAFKTPEGVIALCEAYNKAIAEKEVDPLIMIPMFISDFLCIHPFIDGNGRTSRLFTSLLLYKEGYTVGKYISLEMIIEKSVESYYEALQLSQVNWHENNNNNTYFIKYMLEVILEAYKEFDNRLSHLGDSKLSKPQRIEKLFDDTLGKLSKADILNECPDISKITVEKTLNTLLKEDKIIKLGKGRATKYIKNRL